ncbi:MAG: orotidine 5'-phosphate decarboxylase [Planctomycetes bacterium]|jgi:bifunctional enzyme Fae/Hps|nr:orotidine 5'-phosphate decarboxylase [Planctomycetota bacterium]
METRQSKLNPKKRYLQIALNNTLAEAERIIGALPQSDRIIIEAGTPLIKRYGAEGIRRIRNAYEARLWGVTAPVRPAGLALGGIFGMIIREALKTNQAKSAAPAAPIKPTDGIEPYIVADLKMMDRGATEVEIAAAAGANAVTALGHAPVESLDAFIAECERQGVDAMIDMMNVDFPLAVLRKLKKQPAVVILHRGVDEENFNKQKMLPLHEIRRIKGNYDTMIAVAGGDTIREVQSAAFNDADIVVVWKEFYQSTGDTAKLAEEFLAQVK